jgi:hypothetical protein
LMIAAIAKITANTATPPQKNQLSMLGVPHHGFPRPI